MKIKFSDQKKTSGIKTEVFSKKIITVLLFYQCFGKRLSFSCHFYVEFIQTFLK